MAFEEPDFERGLRGVENKFNRRGKSFMSAPKLVEVDCKVVHQTDAAYLIDHDGNEKNNVWIPKSQVEDYCEERDGTITSIFIPEWLAKSKGLI